jgi:RecB family exonuclease
VNGDFRFIESYDELNDTDSIAGTADLIIRLSDDIIDVIDWKTGLDVVEAQNNEQLMILAYMFCKARNIKPTVIVLTICCPMTGVNDDRYDSVWGTSYSYIEQWVRNNVNEFKFK